MPFDIPDNDIAFNANQSRWMSADIDILAVGFNGVGVISGCAVTAQGSPDMTVAIAAGTIRIASGAAVAVTSGNGTITTADATNPRIDLVSASDTGTKTVTAGSAAASPKAPDLPSGHVALAMVYVPANDTTIASNQITDKRVVLDSVVIENEMDRQPATQHASNQEMYAALSGSWSYVSTSGTPTSGSALTDLFDDPTPSNPRYDVITVPGRLLLQPKRGEKLIAYRAFAPTAATQWAVACKISLGGSQGTDDRFHLGVTKDTPTTSGNEVSSSVNAELRQNAAGSYETAQVVPSARSNNGSADGTMYLGLLGHTNNDISVWRSFDGRGWQWLGRNTTSASRGLVANVFLSIHDLSNSGGPVWALVDWVRFAEGSNNLYALSL